MTFILAALLSGAVFVGSAHIGQAAGAGDVHASDAQPVETQADAAEIDVLAELRSAYRDGEVFERVSLATLIEGDVARQSHVLLGIREGATPMLALSLGVQDPLRVIAAPGRLVAWRESDPTRVFVSILAEPFGRGALERVLPPVLLPQIDLKLGDPSSPLLGILRAPYWSRQTDEHAGAYTGVSGDTILALDVSERGRLAGFTVRQLGEPVLRASVESVAAGEGSGFDALFELPSLDATLVPALPDLGRQAAGLALGMPFGNALGVDGRRRPVTLRAMADGAEKIVVLVVDARNDRARTLLTGALAEAELPELAELLGVRIVVMAIGDPRVATTFQRVLRPSTGRSSAVRVLVREKLPAWLTAEAVPSDGVAFSVEPVSWVLTGEHRVSVARTAGIDGGEIQGGPDRSSMAPRSLSERIAEAVGQAARMP